MSESLPHPIDVFRAKHHKQSPESTHDLQQRVKDMEERIEQLIVCISGGNTSSSFFRVQQDIIKRRKEGKL